MNLSPMEYGHYGFTLREEIETVQWLFKQVICEFKNGAPANFVVGMLKNALPRLIGLKNVHLSASTDDILPVLQMLQTHCPRLRGLSIQYVFRSCSPYCRQSLTGGLDLRSVSPICRISTFDFSPISPTQRRHTLQPPRASTTSSPKIVQLCARSP